MVNVMDYQVSQTLKTTNAEYQNINTIAMTTEKNIYF